MPLNDREKMLKAYALEPDPIYPGAFQWPGIKCRPEARIATDLAPLAENHLGEGTHFYVVGYDCPNLTRPEYERWEEFLIKACKQHASFTYYLGKSSPKAIERFKDIATQGHAKPGQIQIYIRNRKGSPLSEAYANQWKTFHFAIFDGKEKQLWLELNHPEGDTTAYNCFYLPPEIAKDEPLLDIYKTRLETVISECCGKPEFIS